MLSPRDATATTCLTAGEDDTGHVTGAVIYGRSPPANVISPRHEG